RDRWTFGGHARIAAPSRRGREGDRRGARAGPGRHRPLLAPKRACGGPRRAARRPAASQGHGARTHARRRIRAAGFVVRAYIRAAARAYEVSMKLRVVNPFSYLSWRVFPLIFVVLGLVLLSPGGAMRSAYAILGGGLIG